MRKGIWKVRARAKRQLLETIDRGKAELTPLEIERGSQFPTTWSNYPRQREQTKILGSHF
jgi:hypothetical protein